MAKVVKDTREVMNIDEELGKIKKTTKKENKETKKTKQAKTNKTKKRKKNNKTSFFKEVKNEVSKVKWPSKKDMVKYSVATISFVVFFALFFYLIDLILALLKAGV